METMLKLGQKSFGVFAALALLVGVLGMPIGEVRADPVPVVEQPKCVYACILGVVATNCVPGAGSTCVKSATSPANAFCNGCAGDTVKIAGIMHCTIACTSGTIAL